MMKVVNTMSVQRSVWHRAFMACSCLGVLLLIVGCGAGENPIDLRLQSDGYTPEKLAREIQIQYTSLDPTNSRRSKESSRPASAQDDGRGGGPGDSSEREPLSFESITKDIKSKITSLQAASGDDVDVLSEVIAEVEKSSMDESLKQKVITALR